MCMKSTTPKMFVQPAVLNLIPDYHFNKMFDIVNRRSEKIRGKSRSFTNKNFNKILNFYKMR